jgi:hypothetical protein
MGYRLGARRAPHKHFLVLFLLFSILANFVPTSLLGPWLEGEFGAPQAQAAADEVILSETLTRGNPGGSLPTIRDVSSVETRYGLAVILVEEAIWEASSSGEEEKFFFPGSTKLSENIETYAEDLQLAMPWTKSLIVTVSPEDDTIEIQKMLERFYFEGNPEDDDLTQLSGIVLIGDVPLPVVNKSGHRFVSLLPYTDFVEPSYVLDENTLDFIRNTENSDSQVEVWHGLIVPPEDSDQARFDQVAAFFEKNHAFHSGEAEYTEFREDIFVGDFIREEEAVNPVAYSSYLRFTELWEELYYSQYSSALLEDVFVQMMGDAYDKGDGLDNDGDGRVDEEAENGADDDGDGLIDEDLGDDFYQIDNDGDGRVDEDGFEDNNNDANWSMQDINLGLSSDGWEDQLMDEDPAGDLNGDGCPGECGVDDSGLTEDHDGDGFPTFWEILYGYDWTSERKPWSRVSIVVNDTYFGGVEQFSEISEQGDLDAQAWLVSEFERNLFGDYYRHPSCTFDGEFHPEYSDDMDFFCDEDGGDEVRVWADEFGTPYGGSCTYNDADCDGLIDEDSAGTAPQARFEDLPDIQSRELLWTLLSRYSELFEQPLGVSNRMIGESGRWDTQSAIDDHLESDMDTSVSLIGKKDELTIQVLGQINDRLEERLDEVVEDIAADVPMILVMRISGDVTYETGGEDEDGNAEVETEEICKDGAKPDLGNDACLQFVNHSSTSESRPFNNYGGLFESSESNNIKIAGYNLWDISDPALCSIWAGTYEEGGQLTEFNSLYSTEILELSQGEIKNRNNCVPQLAEYKDDIPQLCDTPTVEDPIRDIAGAKLVDDSSEGFTAEQIARFDVGISACYEFREMTTIENYYDAKVSFNDWLTGKIRRFRRGGGDEESDYEEFLDKVADKIDETDADGATLRKSFDSMDMIAFDEGDGNFTYTMIDLMKDLGYTDLSDDGVDLFIASQGDWNVTVYNPQYGSGSLMSDVTKIKVSFDKVYVEGDSLNRRETTGNLTTDEDSAYGVSSIYKHVMPTKEVLNIQVENGVTSNLPIDKTRRVSFMDLDWDPQVLNYLNTFEASSLEDVEAQIAALALEVSEIDASAGEEVAALMDHVNRDVLDDALEWKGLNIDEKHAYVFTHYLGDEQPFFAKRSGGSQGYEMASIIVDGTATSINYGFNGDRQIEEGDLEFLYGAEAEIEAALSASSEEDEGSLSGALLSDSDYSEPVLVTNWLDAVQEWMNDFTEDVSSHDIYNSGGLYCGTEPEDSLSGNFVDVDDDGVDDRAGLTVELEISTEQYDALQIDVDLYMVSVRGVTRGGLINSEDSSTSVQLDVLVGEDGVELYGSEEVTLVNGMASFALIGRADGDFTVRASASAREDLDDSNTLSGVVSDKVVVVSTYVSSDFESSDLESEDGEQIEIFDEKGHLVAVVDPVSGDIDIRKGSVELAPASGELPTRILFVDEDAEFDADTVMAALALVPEQQEILVSDVLGIQKNVARESGLFVQIADLEAELEERLGREVFAEDYGLRELSVNFEEEELGADGENIGFENDLLFWVNGEVIGQLNNEAQIALSSPYSLRFENIAEPNFYELIHIVDETLDTVFTVQIGKENLETRILPSTGIYEDYLLIPEVDEELNEGFLTRLFDVGFLAGVPKAQAASVISDSDGDLLDDLEEWTIGTLSSNKDTDADGFLDGLEVFAGYSPLAGNAQRLFTDISADHVAYHDLAVLYLRGVISGYSDGSFRPDSAMTREEFVKVNLGAICVQCSSFHTSYEAELLSEYYRDPFPDTGDINIDLLACVAEAEDRGIVSGYEGGVDFGKFLPKNNISPAEATKVLVETGGLNVNGFVGDGLPWYSEYVRTAQREGLFPESLFFAGGDLGGLGSMSENDFYTWFQSDQASNGAFKQWLEGEITRSEFVQMAVNLIDAQDCREIDTDGDGLSDAEEDSLYGTDPDLADTDAGGVNDFEEVIRSSDPLDNRDDFESDLEGSVNTDGDGLLGDLLGLDLGAGLYIISDFADYEQIYSAEDFEEGDLKDFVDETPADGQSVLFVQADIRDQSDELYTDDSSSVIEFVLSSEAYGELVTRKIQVENGQAETQFVSSIEAGDLTIEARIVDGSLPTQAAAVVVYPGQAARLEIETDSSVLPAGGEAVSGANVLLYDVFGNIANHGFESVTIDVEGGIEILDLFDEDSEQAGVQVSTPDGLIEFRILASESAGESALIVYLNERQDVNDRLEIEHIEGMQLELQSSQSFMLVGSETAQVVDVRAVNALGSLVDGFGGEVSLSLNDPSYGSFSENSIVLENGVGSSLLTAGTRSGNGVLLAQSTGLASGSLSLNLKPDAPVELRIRHEDEASVLQAGESESFVIEAFDQYGNFARTESGLVGTIRITEQTSQYGTLSRSSFRLNQGQANFNVDVEDISGQMNLVAVSSGLSVGSWGGGIEFSLDSSDFAELEPDLLYASLLGGPFGDVTQEDYIGGWMTFNGRTQAVTSLIAEPIPKERLILVDSSGSISIPGDSSLTQTVSAAQGDLPLRMVWRDFPEDNLMGEFFYVLPDSAEASVELLSTAFDLELEESNGVWLLREDLEPVVKVRADGQIEVMNSLYSIVVNGLADGLGFGVLRSGDSVLRVDFEKTFGSSSAAVWSSDVSALDSDFDFETWEDLSAGLYFKPAIATEPHVVPVASGNSTASPRGLAIVDRERELPHSMQPSLGATSLESAEDHGGVGWETENKHLMLFAAGNSVGRANLFYASEVGVVLGDPSISLTRENSVNDLGYSSDLGTQVLASQEELLQLLELDVNGDDQPDVLAVYEDGRIDLLENTDSAERLKLRGTLLQLENGIADLDSGDFNGDGLEDLVIVTEDSCFADEMCLYIFENIGGGFSAQNLSLSGLAKPTQISAGDLNNDGYSELVVVDENMVLYVIWNVFGELTTVDEIEDFGLNASRTQDLKADVLVKMNNMESGSVSLSILSEVSNEDSAETLNTDVEAWVSGLSGDFDLSVNGAAVDGSGAGETLMRQVAHPFEKADNEIFDQKIAVTKKMHDLNGGRVEVGDRITVSLSIENDNVIRMNDIYFSDLIGDFYDYNEDLTCSVCTELNASVELQNGNFDRPWIYGPVSLEAGEKMELSYSMAVSDLPNLSVMIGEDFYDDTPSDGFNDLAVSLEGDTGGQLMVYYSDGYAEIEKGGSFLGLGSETVKRMNYTAKEYSPSTHTEEYEQTAVEHPLGDDDADGIPDFMEDFDEDLGFPIPSSGTDFLAETLGAQDENGDGYYGGDELFKSDEDADNDGLLDTIDEWVNTADLLIDPSLSSGDQSEDTDAIAALNLELDLVSEDVENLAQVIEDVVSKYTCDGGCLAFPGSISFLTPGNFHDPYTGAKLGKDNGFPVLGITTTLPYVCTGTSCNATSIFRMYLSPTTTLGLGLGLCSGPKQLGQCYAFSLPVLNTLGFCDAINSFISDSLSDASDFVQEGGSQLIHVSNEATASDDATALSSSIFDNYVPPVTTETHIQVPGFPDFFTGWWKAQKLELIKMMDLPDIIFRYPDPKSFGTEIRGIGTENAYNQANGTIDLDFEANTKIEALNSSVMGLESFLNMAHALPLIDIETQRVNIYYPNLESVDLEIITDHFREGAEQWALELKKFKDDFLEKELKGEVDAELQAAYDEIVGVVEEIIAGIEGNLAALESYARLPEQILAIRELESYYAHVIICYVDAILSTTAGYLLENVEKVQAWVAWVAELRGIIDGWQALFELSMDFMESCDKCTNQRWSGMQMLFSLFVFVPDLPVVELPKLPDVVIDVSHIQTGVDIVWPDIHFVPQIIDIPEVPGLSLPDIDLLVDVNFDLNVTIPVLPEFPILFELPQLPGLPLPNLPSLPPPPEVPSILPSVESSLSIASNLLRIVCTIRQGFIPIPEFQLKAKIEEITQRPAGVIQPFDLAITVKSPSFNFDFLERIEINTFLNLTYDLTLLFDLVKDFGEQSQATVSDNVSGLNTIIENAVQAIWEPIDRFGGLEIEGSLGVDLEGGAGDGEEGFEGDAEGGLNIDTSSFEDEQASVWEENPAWETAQQYQGHPLIQENLAAFTSSLFRLQGEMDAWAETLPEDVELIASEVILHEADPILNRYQEIIADDGDEYLSSEFLASIEGTPLAGLTDLRGTLIAHSLDFETDTRQLAELDDALFYQRLAWTETQEESTYLASAFDYWLPASERGFESAVAVASLNETALENETSDWALKENLAALDSRLPEMESKGLDILLASEDSYLDGLELGDSVSTFDEGIFIYNADVGVSSKLIDYTQETDGTVHLLFSDLDSDGDEEVIYSMGGDVYIKENHLEEARVTHVVSRPGFTSLEEMGVDYGSVRNLEVSQNEHEGARFNFDAQDGALGYDILLYDSLDAQATAPEENIKRVLLLNEVKNEDLALNELGESGTLLLDGGREIEIENSNEIDLPSALESRVMAVDTNSQVHLLNAFRRTEIGSNSEIGSESDVLLQSSADTVIEIKTAEGEARLEVPGGMLLRFGRENERTIRIESGSVYWIEEDTLVEEQDMEVGMEIFENEIISLDSSRASLSLETSEGATLELDEEEVFHLQKLSNSGSPQVELELENGAYYVTARALYSAGGVGTLSDVMLLNPQVCADESEPFILLDDQSVELALFATGAVSAEQSFDSGSEIVDAYWDLDISVDANGDGDPENDEEFIGLSAVIGPYEDISDREARVYVTDAAGNTASAEVSISLYVPDLILTRAVAGVSGSDESLIGGIEVEGKSSPLSPNLAFDLVRDRSGALTLLGPDGHGSALGEGSRGLYTTDEYGTFLIEDLNASDLLSIFNSSGDVVAQFNPKTRQVISLSTGYEVMALPSEGEWPARLVVYEVSTGLVLSSFLLVADDKSGINVLGSELSSNDLSIYERVSTYFYEDSLDSTLYSIESDKIVAKNELGSTGMVLDESGNIAIYDANFEVVKRSASSLDEYLVLEIYRSGELIFEIWPGSPDVLNVLDANTLGLPASSLQVHESLSADFRLQFVDIAQDDPLYTEISELVERGVVEGEEVAGQSYFYPDRLINRAEFAKIVEGILCIVPSEAAYLEPAVFNDVLNTDDWFYPYTKEAQLRGLITGYLGETDANGLAPYKATANITRAEAAKIVIEALASEGFIELPSAQELEAEPWYVPYLEIAMDLEPYLVDEQTGGSSNFILTTAEAADPLHELTRYEFVEISARVLQAYNCFDLDSDGDGLANYEEESIYGSDAYNPDTDSGGVDDGTEVSRGTDPLFGDDDFDEGGAALDGGIYAVQESCIACPCQSFVDYESDLRPGDEVFAIIQNEDGTVYGVSNRLEVLLN